MSLKSRFSTTGKYVGQPENNCVTQLILMKVSCFVFHFKVDIQVAFFLNNFFREFSRLRYLFGLLIELFYFPLVDYMYKLMYTVFFGHKIAYTFGFEAT